MTYYWYIRTVHCPSWNLNHVLLEMRKVQNYKLFHLLKSKLKCLHHLTEIKNFAIFPSGRCMSSSTTPIAYTPYIV